MYRDMVPRRFSWIWKAQHHPRVLDDRRILIFNNEAGRSGPKKVSSVIEFDVVDDEAAWSYRANQVHALHSGILGAAHRLPNGNTLIIESNNGRGFEVTAGKEVV